MKLCIIGSQNKSDFDVSLINSAKKYFEKVLFIPITHLAVINEVSSFSVKYRNTDLSKFDAVLFKVPVSRYPLAYYISKNLKKETAVMQTRFSFLRASSRIFLHHALKKENIRVPKSLYSADAETIKANARMFSFPVLVKVTDKNRYMLANSEQELKSMVDALETLKQPLIIEEYHPEASLFRVYIVDNEVVANFRIKNPELNYTEGTAVESRTVRKITNTALKTCKALGTDVGVVSIIDADEPIVVDVDVCPYFDKLESEHSEKVITCLKAMAEQPKSSGILSKFIEEFKKTFKEKFSLK